MEAKHSLGRDWSETSSDPTISMGDGAKLFDIAHDVIEVKVVTGD